MKRVVLYLLLAIALILIAARSLAAVEGFGLSWWTVDNGGGTSQGGETLKLLGSIGQPEAGPSMQGGQFSVSGGFLPSASSTPNHGVIYLPVILR